MNYLYDIFLRLKKQKHFLYIIIVIALHSCILENNSPFKCNIEKGLFTSENVCKIPFESIKSYKDFKFFEEKVRDTIHQCTLACGFLYNIKDYNFIPNVDTSKNILIPCFKIFSNNCYIDTT